MNLLTTIQARLVLIPFITPLRLDAMTEAECTALQGTYSKFVQGVHIHDGVHDGAAILLNRWNDDLTASVFERFDDTWQEIDDLDTLDEAISLVIGILILHVLYDHQP